MKKWTVVHETSCWNKKFFSKKKMSFTYNWDPIIWHMITNVSNTFILLKFEISQCSNNASKCEQWLMKDLAQEDF